MPVDGVAQLAVAEVEDHAHHLEGVAAIEAEQVVQQAQINQHPDGHAGQRLALRLDQAGPRRLAAAARMQSRHAVAAQLRHARRRRQLRWQPGGELKSSSTPSSSHLNWSVGSTSWRACRSASSKSAIASLPPADWVGVLSPVDIQAHPALRTPLLVRHWPRTRTGLPGYFSELSCVPGMGVYFVISFREDESSAAEDAEGE